MMQPRKRAKLGSPPPMRGKVWRLCVRRSRCGITPAHAGKSNSHRDSGAQRQDHPRPCGEKEPDARYMADVPGSPPPMRGKEMFLRHSHDSKGITPAHAGKRAYFDGRSRRRGDHPRPCGEKSVLWSAQSANRGSPPPMRGKVRGLCLYAARLRITPAHAGKSLRVFMLHSRAKGSPPPMRGKATIVVGEPLNVRITPAWAGVILSHSTAA